MWDDIATDGQISYIMRMLDTRVVTRKTADKLIRLLEDCNMVGDNGMNITHIKNEVNENKHKHDR